MGYQDIKDRLYHGHRRIANNTHLTQKPNPTILHPEYVEMRLHGNLVALFYPDYLELYSAGWYTNTTKDRLNLALGLAGIGYSIYQANYHWYYGSHRHIEFYDGMKIDYTGKVIS